MTGLHYPDNLYADHEERKARRTQAPTGAYRAPAEIPEAERKLRTARHHLYHALLLVDEALGDNEPKAQREAKIAYDVACDKPKGSVVIHEPGVAPPGGWKRFQEADPERVPKWDPAWGRPPNCDGLSARDIRSPHPMASEVIRDRDERLAGGEDRL